MISDADYADLRARMARDTLSVRALHVQGTADVAGIIVRQGLQLRVGASATTLWVCTGVPKNAMGSNGDYCFRYDGGTSAHLYSKSAGAWGAVI